MSNVSRGSTGGEKVERRRFFWPVIVDVSAAQEATRQGLYACIWIVGGNAISMLLHFDWEFGLIVAGLFIVIGLGIYYHSPMAAIAGLGFFLIYCVIVLIPFNHETSGMVLISELIITVMLINCVRGTFAIRRFSRGQQVSTNNL
jgi:hypothetical protein